MTLSKSLKFAAITAFTAVFLHQPSHAAVSFTGKIDMFEVWGTGNVAFTLHSVTTGYCNNQFIVNKSLPGAKILLATLTMAKSSGRQVRVASYVDNAGCIAAENYGGVYISPAYIYLLDQ